MDYVEKIEVEHVLKAMQLLGWESGKKPPTYVDIRVQCKSMFGNGGDGNRLKELRQQAIAQALLDSGATPMNTADTSTPPRLPEELQVAMEGLARDIGARLNTFDRIAATHLDRYRTDAEAAANARVHAVRTEATEQAAAYDDEISAALFAIESRDGTIADLESKLSAALTAAAHAEGRASALADQVAAQELKIRELEQGLKEAKSGTKPSGTSKKEKPTATGPNTTGKAASAAQKSNNPAESGGSSSSMPAPLRIIPQTGGQE